MVINNGSFEEQIKKLLSQTTSELHTIEREIDDLVKKRDVLKVEVQAYEATLASYFKRTGKQPIQEIDWRQLLRDKTHREQLIIIAEHKGGKVQVSEATDILIHNGLIDTKRRANGYVIVQSTLADLVKRGIFRKLEAGEYGLVDTQRVSVAPWQKRLPGVTHQVPFPSQDKNRGSG
jgi:hypothetical protein